MLQWSMSIKFPKLLSTKAKKKKTVRNPKSYHSDRSLCYFKKQPHNIITHRWKQTSTFDLRKLELFWETFTFNEWANFLKSLSLENPWILTLSQKTFAPGFIPGEFSTAKPGDSRRVVYWPTTAKPKKEKNT